MIDTDVIVDHLLGRRALSAELTDWSYSIVTRSELFAGRPTEEPAVAALLTRMRELGVDRSIAERAGRLRGRTRIATPDALIAATAIAHRLPLLTRNARHFGRVPGLQLVDS